MTQPRTCCCPPSVELRGDAPAAAPLPGACCAAGPCSPSQALATMRLTELRAGQVATICECALEPRDASVLRAMGLKHSARVRVCRVGEPFVVEVLFNGDRSSGSSRIGLARPLAGRVMVGDVSQA